MREPAGPRVTFCTLINLETDARRRRIQARTGYPGPRLVEEALKRLETDLMVEGGDSEPSN